MRRRELILSVALGVCLIATWLIPSAAKRKDSLGESKRISKEWWQHQIEDALEEQQRLQSLRDWANSQTKHALPEQTARAQTVYQNCLLELFGQHGIDDASITPAGASQLEDGRSVLSMQLEFRATGLQATSILAAIERAPVWHRVSQLSLDQGKDTADERLQVRMVLEAMSTPGAPDRNELQLTATAATDDLKSSITSIFPSAEPADDSRVQSAAPTLPPSVPRPDPASADDLVLIGLPVTNGICEVWVYDRQKRQHEVLSNSAEIARGDFRGRVTSVDAESVVIVCEAGWGRWRLGQNLSQLSVQASPPGNGGAPRQ